MGNLVTRAEIQQEKQRGFVEGAFEQFTSADGGGNSWVVKYRTEGGAAELLSTYHGIPRPGQGWRISYFPVHGVPGAVGYAYTAASQPTEVRVVWKEGECVARVEMSSIASVPVSTFSGSLAGAAKKIYGRTRGRCWLIVRRATSKAA